MNHRTKYKISRIEIPKNKKNNATNYLTSRLRYPTRLQIQEVRD